ncbi:MAG: hypothetical protein US50_C0053G0003 [Candidatus Nomurabacteria bacterium GW2011_GWB1_37_5]|uniref:Uncharacterized protein n=1 Tax=Candidatus Nomurabacteria bacterium GW2011_GWB1_37_5 TaxID=1618742 RepID=A0A0G0GW76_9BACT|nr:MAG: hypothetical protein US50_C0053G0003 [Candidatus Nomurabacteria bacterium GW2011_GWB1_37_5]
MKILFHHFRKHLGLHIFLLMAAIVLVVAVMMMSFGKTASQSNADTSSGNVSGWAWSDNIGWISFNGTGYGVSVDTTNKFFGYAWSDNIGWISFNEASLTNPPNGLPKAILETNNEVKGWARACTVFQTGCAGTIKDINGPELGGWDGWISLNCANTATCDVSDYKVRYDPTSKKLSGYAWGDNVVGWIKFSASTPPEDSNDYFVMIDLSTQTSCQLNPSSCNTDGGGETGGGTLDCNKELVLQPDANSLNSLIYIPFFSQNKIIDLEWGPSSNLTTTPFNFSDGCTSSWPSLNPASTPGSQASIPVPFINNDYDGQLYNFTINCSGEGKKCSATQPVTIQQVSDPQALSFGYNCSDKIISWSTQYHDGCQITGPNGFSSIPISSALPGPISDSQNISSYTDTLEDGQYQIIATCNHVDPSEEPFQVGSATITITTDELGQQVCTTTSNITPTPKPKFIEF